MSHLNFRALGGGLTAAALALGGAAAYVAHSGGFGAGDLAPFAIWCTLLAGFVTMLCTAMAQLRLPVRRLARIALAVLTGLFAGGLFTFAVALGLGPWIGAFSFPVLYLWAGGAAAGLALMVWPAQSHAREGPRVARLLMGAGAVLGAVVLLPWVLVLGGAYLWDRAEPEVHLIPQGYEGPVVIIFDQPMGTAAEREGRARLYRIPPDGVLRTRFGPNDGWSAPDYFYVDAAGRRSSIVRGAPCADSLAGDPLQACLMGRMYISDRTGPEYEAYVLTRQVDKRVNYERGDSLVRAAVFGELAAPAP